MLTPRQPGNFYLRVIKAKLKDAQQLLQDCAQGCTTLNQNGAVSSALNQASSAAGSPSTFASPAAAIF